MKDLPPADARLRDLAKKRHEGFGSSPRDPGSRCGRVREELRRLPPDQRECAAGWTAARWDRHPWDRPTSRRYPRPEPQRGPGLPRDGNVAQSAMVSSFSGLLLKEEGEILVFADAQGKEVRVPKESVEERTTSQLSPMPANLAEVITGWSSTTCSPSCSSRRRRPQSPARGGGGQGRVARSGAGRHCPFDFHRQGNQGGPRLGNLVQVGHVLRGRGFRPRSECGGP